MDLETVVQKLQRDKCNVSVFEERRWSNDIKWRYSDVLTFHCVKLYKFTVCCVNWFKPYLTDRSPAVKVSRYDTKNNKQIKLVFLKGSSRDRYFSFKTFKCNWHKSWSFSSLHTSHGKVGVFEDRLKNDTVSVQNWCKLTVWNWTQINKHLLKSYDHWE